MTLKPSTGVSFGSLLSFFTPGFCSQQPQSDLAADLPDTGWLTCDHPSGLPASSLGEHEHDLLSLFLPPRNTKNSFFSLLLPASHKDRQGNSLGWLFQKDYSPWVKITVQSSAYLTAFHVISDMHVTIPKNFKSKGTHCKAS